MSKPYLTALESQVGSLSTTVNGLMTAVDAIQNSVGTIGTTVDTLGDSVGNLSDSISATNSATAALQDSIDNLPDPADYTTELADLATGLADAQTAIASITAQLEGVVTPGDLATISSTLAQVQADVRELLNANMVINQSVNITNRAQLLLAESLIGTETTDPNVIINGSVTVLINTTNFTAAEIVRVNALTTKIATVLNFVSATSTASPSVAINFANLNFVDGNYTVSGADANDPMLATISGNLTIDHTGNADYSQVTTINGNVIIDTGVTSINLSGATINGNVSSNGSGAGVIVLPKATAVNIGTAEVNTASLTLAEGTVNLGYADDVASNVLIEAPKAAIIDFAAKTVAGSLMVTAPADTTFNAPNLTTASATTITADIANFPKLTQFTADTVITADTVTLPELTGNVSGTIDLPTADSFVAPKFTITNNVSATDAITIAFKTGSDANLSAPKVKTLTINAQGNRTDFDTSGYGGTLETFNFTGVVGTTAPLISTVTNTINIGGGKLKSVTVAGMADSVIVSGTGDLTSLTTDGDAQIRNFTLNNADELVSASIGHQHIEGSDAAMFTVTDNLKLASLATTNLDETGNIDISNNAALASLNLSSLQTLPLLGSYTVTITNNKLTGMYTAATAGSTTTAAVDESLTSAAFATLKPYMQKAVASRASASTGNVTYTLAVNLSNVATTGTTTLTAALAADTVRTATATSVLTDT